MNNQKQKFVVDLEMLHLAMELALAAAGRAEVERQFREQYPNLQLNLRDYNVDIGTIRNLAINVTNFDVEYK